MIKLIAYDLCARWGGKGIFRDECRAITHNDIIYDEERGKGVLYVEKIGDLDFPQEKGRWDIKCIRNRDELRDVLSYYEYHKEYYSNCHEYSYEDVNTMEEILDLLNTMYGYNIASQMIKCFR